MINSRLLLLLVALTFATRLGPAYAAERPNIVLIMADDVGVDAIGCYGGAAPPTPHIDELARSGTRFDYCFSMPVCHPTRVCLMTGRYPINVGNPEWGSFPRDREQHTLAHLVKHAGYATAIAGKWQLGLLKSDLSQPNRMGFDKYCLFGWHEGPRYHDPLVWQDGALREQVQGCFGPDLYVDYLIDFFRSHQSQPFFALYSMALCHDVTDDLDQPVPYAPGKDRYLSFDEMVTSMDDCVGRIVKAIDELGLRENTWIIFTADNGTARESIVRAEPNKPSDQEAWTYLADPVFRTRHGRRVAGGKGTLTDAGTNVPLIVSRRQSLPSGQVVADLVDFSDFLPTIVELCGASKPTPLCDGFSFAPRLLGTGQQARSWAFSERRDGQFWVRTQRYKLHSSGSFTDMQQNPDETPLPAGNLDGDPKRVHTMLQAAAKSFQQ